MRTALFAGLVAGAAALHALPALAEGSSLRGLKPPRDAFEARSRDDALEGEARFKARLDALPEIASGVSIPGAALESRALAAADFDFRFGRYRPLGQYAALRESTLDPIHDVLPKYGLYTQVNKRLPGGWGLGLGVRHSEYNFSASDVVALSAERYWGSFRGAYTLYSGRADGVGGASAHRFQLSYAYGERNTVGLAYTAGRDIDNVALPYGMTGDVRDWMLSGRHWLSPNWALTYDVLAPEQSTPFRRQGLRLGVSRSF